MTSRREKRTSKNNPYYIPPISNKMQKYLLPRYTMRRPIRAVR